MLAYVARRAASGAVVLVIVTLLIFGVSRWAWPEDHGGRSYAAQVGNDVERALLHLDFGHACGWRGCPPVHSLWVRGIAADLFMLAGGLALGVLGGVYGGIWCARRKGTRRARLVESLAVVAYCAPVYAVGLGLIYLFNPEIGVWSNPWFFDVRPTAFVSPGTSPWGWFRAYLGPWLVVAAPLAAACLRMTARVTREELHADHVRTAIAKGLRQGRVVRRHAATGAYPAISSLAWGYIPIFVANVVLVEWVFDVPGFWFATKRALNQDPHFAGFDIPTAQALALWSALVIVVLSILADVALAALDPRVRQSGRP